MSTYEVNSEAIAAASAAVRTSASTITNEVGAMHARLVELQSSWRGSASAAFASVVDQWRGAQRGVEDALNSINQALAAAGTTYSDAEAQATRLFSR